MSAKRRRQRAWTKFLTRNRELISRCMALPTYPKLPTSLISPSAAYGHELGRYWGTGSYVTFVDGSE